MDGKSLVVVHRIHFSQLPSGSSSPPAMQLTKVYSDGLDVNARGNLSLVYASDNHLRGAPCALAGLQPSWLPHWVIRAKPTFDGAWSPGQVEQALEEALVNLASHAKISLGQAEALAIKYKWNMAMVVVDLAQHGLAHVWQQTGLPPLISNPPAAYLHCQKYTPDDESSAVSAEPAVDLYVCPVCSMEMPAEEMAALWCQHAMCKSC